MGSDISKLLYSRNTTSSKITDWDVPFLNPSTIGIPETKRGLIILNQPFSQNLLELLWTACSWHCCADGGANRLFDLFREDEHGALRAQYIPDLIKGDLDSLRTDVQEYYTSKGAPVVQDHDQDSTDLMKCVQSLQEKEKAEGQEYEIIVLGGLTGRLDQTIHTLSCLYKLRRVRGRTFVVTDDNVSWVLDEGQHRIHIDHDTLGPTCGLLPIGVDSTLLTTSGLRWNLDAVESSFDGLVSTSNHLLLEESFVTIKTSRPIWWCVELRQLQS
ncbi:thiamine pyrophosphokinase [Scleroderma yunnanense]